MLTVDVHDLSHICLLNRLEQGQCIDVVNIVLSCQFRSKMVASSKITAGSEIAAGLTV